LVLNGDYDRRDKHQVYDDRQLIDGGEHPHEDGRILGRRVDSERLADPVWAP
jgi:hypothetical protein